MKIYNLILLNFCFIQLFPLLFGMHPGAGPSGSQQQMTLDEKIRELTQDFGDSEPHPEIIPRRLGNEEPMQLVDTVAKQYDNLLSAYNKLNTEFENSSKGVQNIPIVRLHYMGNHEMQQRIDAEANQLDTRIQQISNEQLGIIEDMQKIYNHLKEGN
uniref:Uncharacterized protein n=1 Tax=Meloidogyne enterolobii TaxID=390850 RepID=A0A6V7TNY4_MELEN|nr:unnamed protein product [Meloidogyne enterolobii]